MQSFSKELPSSLEKQQNEDDVSTRRRSLPGRIIMESWLPGLLVVCVALGLNFYRLGDPSLWFDEILSVTRAIQPLPVVWKIIWTTQPNMALYYLLLHFWLDVTNALGFAPTETVVRLPSAICAALSALVVFQMGRRYLSLSVALLASGLYVINALQLTYAQETRSYGLQLLLLSLAWYALLNILTQEKLSWRWLVVYGLTATLSVYTQIFSLLVLLSQVVAVVCLLVLPTTWRERTRLRFRPLLFCGIVVGILLVPILLASRGNDKTGWIPIPDLGDALHVFTVISGDQRLYEVILLGLCLLSVIGALCVQSTWLRTPLLRLPAFASLGKQPRLRQFFPVIVVLACWFVIPFVLSYIISQGSTRLFIPRYLVTIVPSLMLLAGASCMLIPWRYLRVTLMVGALFVASWAVPLYYQSAEVEDWQTPTAWLQDHYQSGDGMVCYDNDQGCEVGIEYYLRAYPTDVTFPEDAPGAFPWVHYDTTNQLGDSESALDTTQLAAYMAQHKRLFFIVARLSSDDQVARVKATQQWLNSHYQYQDQVTTPTMTIYLYKVK
ncbi:hypothetical protein KSD_29260 [Ktedonobacter sp. SOSP1-85]|uniref:glycosyltransferase family 39 protein n=1 Tax=Ktedonobacter sp. SOSP1-85 TaxID=2778367 RepID=UPI0019161EEE|nr:glycosyltransferase family 39 protein [Ktedonobacter sp. SOSP1-85]GHO75155.1 hypothetical protein KSD_29260 [Ktedonobacter sp. SOSP1-85]